MKGFSQLEKGKLIISFKKCNIYQLLDIQVMVESEIQRRKKKESKALKNVKS